MSTKSDVLYALEKSRGASVSGQELGDRLGISRSAIWKAINALRQDGYVVDSAPNGGYRLASGSDVLSAEGVLAFLPQEYRGRVFVYPSVGSTNTEARRMALDGAPHGTLVAASEQTAGRGRSGKSFYSPRDTGLYLSVILRPREAGMDDTQMITVAAAVAACRALEKTAGISPRIKWVNDLYLNGKKVCGILTEAVGDFESGQIETVVVGIGVNCTTSVFPSELGDVAGSLCAKGLSRCRLAASILEELMALTKSLRSPELIAEYRDRSLMLGRTISYVRNGTETRGTVLDINNHGNLIVKNEDGGVVSLSSGEVSITGGII